MSRKNTNRMFEVAVRTKMRFPTVRGEATVEDLWDIPLRSRDNFNLDFVAKEVNKALKEVTEESFVQTRNPDQKKHELRLEIVKYVIQTKLEEEEEKKKRAEKQQLRARALEILEEREKGELETLSDKELRELAGKS